MQAISLAVHARTYHAHMRELEALLRVLMSCIFLNFICLHVRAISPAMHARLYSPALRRLQSRGVRACSTYTLLHVYHMNHACKEGTHIRMMHHTACPCATHAYTHETLPWQLFDVKYIVDHSVLHAQENCHNRSWQCKPLHVGTATNTHTPAFVAHTCTAQI